MEEEGRCFTCSYKSVVSGQGGMWGVGEREWEGGRDKGEWEKGSGRERWEGQKG